MAASENAIEVEDLHVTYRSARGLVPAVRGVTFSVRPGEVLAVVGESGCGKSATALALMRMIRPFEGDVSGSIRLDGTDVLTLDEARMRRVRGGQIAMVFQDPMSSLNPTMTIGAQIVEMVRFHLGLGRAAAVDRARECLAMVGLPDPAGQLGRYAFEFSGGMRQRVMIAMALSCDPKVLIADEATTALDVTIQAQVLELIADLNERLGMAVVMITHDLGVAAGVADRLQVMYAGTIVESGTADQVFAAPEHPYTRGLLASIPRLETDRAVPLTPIGGAPPRPSELPSGCPFHPRCALAFEPCPVRVPHLAGRPAGEHDVSCWAVS